MAAAGGEVGLRTIQERSKPDPATFVGKGKLEELALACDEQRIDLVVFDHELSPSQLRQVERILKVRVIDRTQLILDIFARRARTREGKWQVELAQLQYLLPRLVGSGVELSRLGGGIGTRGPGETKLETDRRRIRHRIATIGASIEAVRQRRSRLRDRRQKGDVPTVALVGYTNAGKTTLFNLLTRESAVVSDALFVTLDPLVRKVRLPDQRELLVSDTVGLHRPAAAHAGGGVPGDARGGSRGGSAAARHRRVGRGSRPPDDRRAQRARRGRRGRGAADRGVQQGGHGGCGGTPAAGTAGRRFRGNVGVACAGACGTAGAVTARLGLDVERVTLRANPDSDAGRKGIAWVYRHGRVVRHTNSKARAIIEVDLPRRDVAAFRETWAGSPDVRLGRGRRMRRARILLLVVVWRPWPGVAPPRRRCRRPPPDRATRTSRIAGAARPCRRRTHAGRHERAWQMLQAGDVRGASQEFLALAQRAPSFYPAAVGLGYALVADGKPKDALPRFDQAIRLAPAYAPALAGRGDALLAAGQRDAALASFEAALAADRSLVELRRRIDVLRFGRMRDLVAAASKAAEAGRLDEARRGYEAAIAASPESAFLYRDLGVIETRMNALESGGRAPAEGRGDGRERRAGVGRAGRRAREARRRCAGPCPRWSAPTRSTRPTRVKQRLDRDARARRRWPACPDDYKAIPGLAQVTRGDLAALLGVRLQARGRREPDPVRRRGDRRARPLGGGVDHERDQGRPDGRLPQPHVPAARGGPPRGSGPGREPRAGRGGRRGAARRRAAVRRLPTSGPITCATRTWRRPWRPA